MKRVFKTLICAVLAASLCIAGCSSVFASSSDPELSLEDLLGLLSQLGDSGEEEGTTEVAEDDTDMTVYTLGEVSFAVPADWTGEEIDESMLGIFAPDFSSYLTSMYQEGSPEEIDIHNPDNIAGLTDSIGYDAVINKMEYVTVQGRDAIWIEVGMEEDSLEMNAEVCVIQLDEAIFMVSLVSLKGTETEFRNIVESITIEGSYGETDLSAVTDGSASVTPAPQNTGSAEGLDATAVDEVVLIDDDLCTVTMKKFGSDDYYGMVAKVFVENKSDMNLYVNMDAAYINGYQVSAWWGETVSAGHKSNSDFHVYKDDLEKNGITDIRELEFKIVARNDDDWSAGVLEEESFLVYPYGTAVPEQPVQEFDDDALVLFDTDDCTMILKDYSTSDYYFSANVYIENKTDITLDFQVTGATAVNGYEINPYFYKTLEPGKKANTSIDWRLEDLEDNDIEYVEDMELDISVKDANDWYADPVYQDLLTVQIS